MNKFDEVNMISQAKVQGKINHGFWDKLQRAENIFGEIPKNSFLKFKVDKRLGYDFFFYSNFAHDVLSLIERAKHNSNVRLSFSSQAAPGQQMNSISFRHSTIQRITGIEEDKDGSLIFKSLIEGGHTNSVLDSLLRDELIVVGPRKLIDFGYFSSNHKVVISSTSARRFRWETAAQIAGILKQSPQAVVLIQGSPVATYLSLLLHEAFPDARFVDMGRAMNVFSPYSLFSELPKRAFQLSDVYIESSIEAASRFGHQLDSAIFTKLVSLLRKYSEGHTISKGEIAEVEKLIENIDSDHKLSALKPLAESLRVSIENEYLPVGRERVSIWTNYFSDPSVAKAIASDGNLLRCIIKDFDTCGEIELLFMQLIELNLMHQTLLDFPSFFKPYFQPKSRLEFSQPISDLLRNFSRQYLMSPFSQDNVSVSLDEDGNHSFNVHPSITFDFDNQYLLRLLDNTSDSNFRWFLSCQAFLAATRREGDFRPRHLRNFKIAISELA